MVRGHVAVYRIRQDSIVPIKEEDNGEDAHGSNAKLDRGPNLDRTVGPVQDGSGSLQSNDSPVHGPVNIKNLRTAWTHPDPEPDPGPSVGIMLSQDTIFGKIICRQVRI